MAAKQDISISAIVSIGAVSLLLLVVVLVGGHAWFLRQEMREMSQYDNAPVYTLENLKVEQRQRIGEYRWIDREKQVAAVPIEEAMRMLVRTQGRLPTTGPAERSP